MENIRNRMLEGRRVAGCETCYEVEDAGYESHRYIWKDTLYNDIEKHSIEVKLRMFGSACNLSCYMCHPVNSTTRNKEISKLKTNMFAEAKGPDFFLHDNEIFEVNADDILKHIDLIERILIIGGEPILMTPHWKFLDSIPDELKKNIILEYQTNLTRLSHMKWDVRDYIPKFKDVLLHVSADHYGPRLNLIRYPIDYVVFEKNVEEMRSNINSINITASMLNAYDLKDIEDYYTDKLSVNTRVASVVQRPRPLSIRNIRDKDRVREMLKTFDYVPEFVLAELNLPSEDGDYQMFEDYIDELDSLRGTNMRDVFLGVES